MLILLTIVTITMLATWGMTYLILKEIKSITTQLEFIKDNNTNMIITSRYSNNSSIGRFINQINELIENTSILRRNYLNKENNLKDTLTNLSHDIRTPLTSLDGYFQLVVNATSSREREQYNIIIKEQIDCLKDMVDTLFTYTKLQNNSYKLELEVCCVNEILMTCLFSFYQRLQDKRIEPELSFTDRLLYVLANENALKRVFQNLIKNCIEHGCGDMQIKLGCLDEHVIISFVNHYNSQMLNVNNIFNMFYKADKARSRTSTGLGLAIVKELIENLQGNIEADVTEGKFEIVIQLPIDS